MTIAPPICTGSRGLGHKLVLPITHLNNQQTSQKESYCILALGFPFEVF